jgi:hypothetical protein
MSVRHLWWAPACAVVCLACGQTQRVDRPAESARTDADESAAAAAPADDGRPLSEGERTRLMEQKADDLVQQYHDAQATATTAEERVKAYQEFEKGRQELNQTSEGDAAPAQPAASDEYAPPPEP